MFGLEACQRDRGDILAPIRTSATGSTPPMPTIVMLLTIPCWPVLAVELPGFSYATRGQDRRMR